MENIKYVTPEDLLRDKGFLEWYYHRNENEVRKWNRWIAACSVNQQLAEEAICLMGYMHIEAEGITDAQIKAVAHHFIREIVMNEKQEQVLI